MKPEAPDADVERRGRLGAMHALGLLDVDDDPVLCSITSMAGRTGRGRCEIWLRGAADFAELRCVTGADGGGGDGGGGDADPPSVRPIMVDDVQVGEVRGHAISATLLRHVADEVQQVLERRLEASRRDHRGQPVGVVSVDHELNVIWTSAEALELGFDTGGRSAVGRPVLDFVDPEEVTNAVPLLERGASGRGRTAVISLTLRLLDGRNRFDIWADNRLGDPSVEALTFVIRPADETGGELGLLGDQMWVLNRLSGGQPLGEVLHRVTDMVEHRDPHAKVCIMEVDEAGEKIHPLIAPHLPVPVVGALIGLPVQAGSPAGAGAIHVDIAQYSPNVAVDPSFAELAPLLDSHGIRACWSMPIRSMNDGKVLGSVDIYRSVLGHPGDADSRVLVLAARLAAIAMDHDTRERELRHAALHDPLTDLPNRAMFSERLEAAAEDGNVGVLFLDLDRFKLVNDNLGHEFGDEVLKVVGRRMEEIIEEPVLVARFGGDEFTVLVPKVELAEDLVEVGRRLLAAVSEPFDIRGHRVVVGASAGAALALGTPDDPHSLVRDADTALYHAKERGRGRVEVFDDRMRAADAERVRIEGVLRDAIDRGGIDAHFQPTVRVSDGRAVGAEALARCTAPDGVPLPPALFIPVAEEVGLLPAVFEAVLTRACEMSVEWNRDRAEPFLIWVNLSPTQLGSSAVVGQIASVFESTGVDATRIGFEVTESGIIPDPEEAADFLGRLKALGAHIAIDDFGTGYSSLGYLQALPVDTVKLDRSFVVRAGDDPRSRAIVGSVVELTRAVGLVCVAEGVETTEQLDVIADLGCTYVQGFVYARPQPAGELSAWLSTRP